MEELWVKSFCFCEQKLWNYKTEDHI